MKRMLLAVLMIIVFSTAAFTKDVVAKGETHSALGDYKIEKASDPFKLNGEECKSFIISYENTPFEVTVVIRKDKNCRKYFVFSDKLSVQYVCKEQYFGVEKLDRSLKSEGYATSDSDMNKTEYFHQKILCSGNNGEIENTQLIAAYFPMLLKNTNDIISSR
jgi:hypothetical protein